MKQFKDQIAFLFTFTNKKWWIKFGAYQLIIILGNILNTIFPFFTKLQIDQLESQSKSILGVESLPLAIFFVLLIVPAMIELARFIFFNKLENDLITRLNTELKIIVENKIWKKLFQLDAGFFLSERNRQIIQSCFSTAYLPGNFFFSFLTRRVGLITSMAIIIPLLSFISPRFMLIIVAASIIEFFLSKLKNRTSQAYSLLESRQYDRYYTRARQMEENLYDLITLGGAEKLLTEVNEIKKEIDTLSISREDANRKINSFEKILSACIVITTNLFVAQQVYAGEASIGTFTLTVVYTDRIRIFFSSLFNTFSEWNNIDYDLEKLQFILSLPTQTATNKKLKDTITSPSKISLESINFTYPSNYASERKFLQRLIDKTQFKAKDNSFYEKEMNKWKKLLDSDTQNPEVLNSVSLELKKGSITALVGKNGSGKTTITHLLQRHFLANKGVIKIDGIPITEYSQELIHEQFSWVKQEPFILERYSIKENLLLGCKDKTSAITRIPKVLKDLGLNTIINKLPQKLDAIIGEDTNFSGGQKQLIAIARAILQERSFIILDEGSSQLDVEKELLVLNLLRKQKDVSGILFITHRMSVAKKADTIYVVDTGKIVQSGTHNSLVSVKGIYSDFWNTQFAN